MFYLEGAVGGTFVGFSCILYFCTLKLKLSSLSV